MGLEVQVMPQFIHLRHSFYYLFLSGDPGALASILHHRLDFQHRCIGVGVIVAQSEVQSWRWQTLKRLIVRSSFSDSRLSRFEILGKAKLLEPQQSSSVSSLPLPERSPVVVLNLRSHMIASRGLELLA